MKNLALLLTISLSALAAGPPAPYLPSPHMVWSDVDGFQSTLQPNVYGAMLISAAGTGKDWSAFTGTGGAAVIQPNSYVGLLTCTANCTSPYSQVWSPWTGATSGGGAPATNPAGGANNYAPIANPVFTGSTASPCTSDTGTAYSVTCPTAITNTLSNTATTGPHWQSDATATPMSVIDQVTSTNSGLTSGIPAGSSCIVWQTFVTSTYFGGAACDQSGGLNLYYSPSHAINAPVFVRDLSCGITVCQATQYLANTYATSTNCSSVASPAVCGSSAAGNVALLASTTTIVVNTTAITANSQVMLTFDSSLSTKLGITCNTNPELLSVSARVAGTSFTITGASPATNGACLSYDIIN